MAPLAARALAVFAFLSTSAFAWNGATVSVSSASAAGRGAPVVLMPAGAKNTTKLPVLFLLQSRCQTALTADLDFRFNALIDSLNFALVIPEASRAPGACGSCPGGALANLNCRAWNATPALAPTRSGIFGLGDATPVDDSAYIMDVLAAVKAKFAVDETRIFAAGADAGGFMAYRMACEQPDTFAAVMSLNGAMVGWNSSQCAAFAGDSSVSVLEVHGMKDTEVPYEGGSFEGAPVPGAAESALLWAQHNGCSAISNGTALELLRHGPFTGGADTEVVDFTACDGGSAVSLWSVDSLRHDVTDTTFTADFARKVMAFFAAHPKGGLPAPAPAQAVGTLSVQSAAPAPAPAASRSSPPPARLVKSPPPPSPPTLLNRIRASLEARNAALALARAPAPAPAALLLARAPAPAPATRELTVNALSGPPGAQEEEEEAGDAPPVEFQPVPSPPPAVVAPSPSPSPMPSTPMGPMSPYQLMAILNDPTALRTLIGSELSANTMIPDDMKAMLGNPAVQAVLTAAAASPNPGQYIMDAMNAAGIDINTLLGVAVAPAPAPRAALPAKKSDAAGVRALGASIAALAAAALLL